MPQSCPVCEHSPLSAEDCNPNKSLRTTIKVFLRTAEKKREASRAKEEKASEPPTPVEAPKPQLPPAEPPEALVTPEETTGGETQETEAPTTLKEDNVPEPVALADEVQPHCSAQTTANATNN